ncbi:hypothetical protein HU200_049640 [Digitaria exilis]|uniref:RNase H type-1 domain-containing protein n=1 Tax=Digitaria exilis TaxID=1010633 RepID=A0A835B4F3_9POAL|nr:hypothetical protein HU200_049640 [Digitaria exilis]
MWSLWSSRNDRRHGKAPIEKVTAINWALDICFHLTSPNKSAEDPKVPPLVPRWQRPPGNTLKVNIDGAFDAEEESGAIGAVVRDAEGGFLMATTRWLPDVGSALAAEAEAPCAGVQLIYTVTEGPVMMKTDSLELVSLWNNRGSHKSEFAPIFGDV